MQFVADIFGTFNMQHSVLHPVHCSAAVHGTCKLRLLVIFVSYWSWQPRAHPPPLSFGSLGCTLHPYPIGTSTISLVMVQPTHLTMTRSWVTLNSKPYADPISYTLHPKTFEMPVHSPGCIPKPPYPSGDGAAAWSTQAGLVRSERPLQWQGPGLAQQEVHPDGASHASGQQGNQPAGNLSERRHPCSRKGAGGAGGPKGGGLAAVQG